MTRHVESRHLVLDQASREKKSPARLTTRIGRTYRFESAHHLPHLPDGHKCKNLHGHNYRVDIVKQGTPDARGFVRDFAEIDGEIAPLLKMVDHRLLNEVPGLENPTAEVIAAWFFERVANCSSVRVWENDDCWAEVTAQDWR
jgi:6-pyruvoyltetrahydropterin/6-carboxytetrahydropterin synthase